MKDQLGRIVGGAASLVDGQNLVREYLQAKILGSLQRAGGMIPLAFHGGTALRFLFALPRFSEDLDFALERTDLSFALRDALAIVVTALRAEGSTVTAKVSDLRVVHSALVGFPGLLHELRLSPHASQVLSIKLEVDTRPPAGATLATTVVRRPLLLHLQHHDRASLLAGKLHALLQRPFIKGRDVFDLMWYLADPAWPPPNLMLLNHALRQTAWTGEELGADTWKPAVRARLASESWSGIVADVRPFIERGGGLEILTRENVLQLLA